MIELVHKIKFKFSPSEKQKRANFFCPYKETNTHKQYLLALKINSSRNTINACWIYFPWLLLSQLAHWWKILDTRYQYNKWWMDYELPDLSRHASLWTHHHITALPGEKPVASAVQHFVIMIFCVLLSPCQDWIPF